MIRRLAILATPTLAALALVAALAFPAAADSPYNSAQGSVKGPETLIRGDVVDVRAAFSASSDATFQETQGASGSAGGMINAQPNAETNPLVPDLGRVQVSCLNVQGNVAVMTGTVSEPISSSPALPGIAPPTGGSSAPTSSSSTTARRPRPRCSGDSSSTPTEIM